ncbi:uncharacterized protein SCHCODRAFT_02272229 [Schizophyllum commune H4-8]|uniref:uncharacterized protein n=1 Tax=Schizophyllum commune (strain H4-8 / FGSC 9210) TaxID=578458 RepID=UPI002160233F|nr:uncharacterized protein SCHCODRAFT_02272229 [Schizophyllum commune H4-8]KAI5894238.1 hypothetical protein SCHCODRAFT_02272229 [Schizophyllum commune H4-8]
MEERRVGESRASSANPSHPFATLPFPFTPSPSPFALLRLSLRAPSPAPSRPLPRSFRAPSSPSTSPPFLVLLHRSPSPFATPPSPFAWHLPLPSLLSLRIAPPPFVG